MSSAPIEFDCPKCQSRLKVPGAIAGRQAKCPKCQEVVNVPMTSLVDPVEGNQDFAPVTSGAVPPVNQPIQPMVPPGMPMVEQPNMIQPNVGPPSQSGMQPVVGANPIAPSAGVSTAPPPESTIEKVVGEETETRKLYERICAEVGKVFVGQEELVKGTLVALFSGGHVLIESVPGLGKTLFIRTLGRILGCDFGRIQFTADLMPSDITGAPVFNMKSQEFDFRPGPIFTQLLLADEINRSPAKTHAALLEIMQEKNVTVDGTTHELTPPFLVMATQNPIESEGTYNLPEAQLDRFMFKLVAHYPTSDQEASILKMHGGQTDLDDRLENEIEVISNPDEIVRITKLNSEVRVDDVLIDYINKIVRLTRDWPQFYMGASPRAGIGLMQGARTLAAFYGRNYAVPDDVREIALSALRHRVSLTAEAEVEGQSVDQLLTELIQRIEVPRMKSQA